MTALSAEARAKVVAKGEAILKEVEESFILTEGGHFIREIPAFRPEEISLGKVLGTGGFAIVQEIRKITLDPASEASCKIVTPAEMAKDEKCSSPAVVHDGDDNESPLIENILSSDEDPALSLRSLQESVNDERHSSREQMAHRVMRNGDARYALKRLLHTLDERERARGMIDLALEAKYLQIVSHPGIIKIRGVAAEPPISRDFFIVLDRLYDILDKRLVDWRRVEDMNKGYLLGIGKKKMALRALLVERMTVAYDLASALYYLHQHQIVYRDLKTENIGFDIRDTVKLFDFGLATSLSPKRKAEGYGYRLTGRAGSIPYMAPEVVKMETYDEKCDVFSFAILLWEILALRQSFQGMSLADFVESVVINKRREPVLRSFPPLTRNILHEAWDDNPRKRPDMRRVAASIRQDLIDMTSDENVLHRTKHMSDLSNHSVHADFGGIRLTRLHDESESFRPMKGKGP